MLALLTLVACAPKTPPEAPPASTDPDPADDAVADYDLGVPGPEDTPPPAEAQAAPPDPRPNAAELPLGQAPELEAGIEDGDARLAFELGLSQLREIRSLAAVVDLPAETSAREELMELTSATVASYRDAAGHGPLLDAATCRIGDAWRLTALALEESARPVEAPEGSIEDALEVSGHEQAASALDSAARSYESCLAVEGADPAWLAHARWGQDTVDAMREAQPVSAR